MQISAAATSAQKLVTQISKEKEPEEDMDNKMEFRRDYNTGRPNN